MSRVRAPKGAQTEFRNDLRFLLYTHIPDSFPDDLPINIGNVDVNIFSSYAVQAGDISLLLQFAEVYALRISPVVS